MMSEGGSLQLLFDADAWDSTISFQPGIPVTLGGNLELSFARTWTWRVKSVARFTSSTGPALSQLARSPCRVSTAGM